MKLKDKPTHDLLKEISTLVRIPMGLIALLCYSIPYMTEEIQAQLASRSIFLLRLPLLVYLFSSLVAEQRVKILLKRYPADDKKLGLTTTPPSVREP